VSAEEISRLQGVELARACAEAMGWVNCLSSLTEDGRTAHWWTGRTYRTLIGNSYGLGYFCPQSDLNHSAEFLAWLLDNHPGFNFTACSVIVQIEGIPTRHYRAELWRGLGDGAEVYFATDTSRALAETRATLMACEGTKK